MNFGERLRELRGQRHVTQRDLARQIGRDHTYISKLEHGAPPPSYKTIQRIALVLSADEQELLILAGKINPTIVRQQRMIERYHTSLNDILSLFVAFNGTEYNGIEEAIALLQEGSEEYGLPIRVAFVEPYNKMKEFIRSIEQLQHMAGTAESELKDVQEAIERMAKE